jgi:hypothetical protein
VTRCLSRYCPVELFEDKSDGFPGACVRIRKVVWLRNSAWDHAHAKPGGRGAHRCHTTPVDAPWLYRHNFYASSLPINRGTMTFYLQGGYGLKLGHTSFHLDPLCLRRVFTLSFLVTVVENCADIDPSILNILYTNLVCVSQLAPSGQS